MNIALEKIHQYEERIEKISSPKRKDKTLRKISKDVDYYANKVRNYMFLQSLTLIIVYMLGLFVIISYFTAPVYFPYANPLVVNLNGKYVVSNVFVYIISFLIFTPISLRRPKTI